MKDWIKITERLSQFGSNLKFFGKGILALATVVSIIFFWFIVMSYYTPYQEVAVLMIQFIKIGVQLVVVGFLIHYLFYFINELIHKRQMSKVDIKINEKNK